MTEDPFRGILYVMDSLRYDWVSCNGHNKSLTPTMDSLAAEGINFDQAFSQAIWTYPSAGSIFTGLYPETHKSQQFGKGLDPAQPHIADKFADTDVTTACFSTTLGVSPDRGFKQSFDEFFHLGNDGEALRPDIMDALTDYVVSWLESNGDDGFFVVIWAMGTHHPYLTPEDDIVEDPTRSFQNVGNMEGTQASMRRLPTTQDYEVRSRYDNVVEYADRRLGDVIRTLEQLGIYDETNIIVTADHGELFNEHARLEHVSRPVRLLAKAVTAEEKRTHYGLFDKTAWVGHQAIYPYDELIHVPLIVKPDSSTDVETDTYDGLVELVDLFPTIYETAGLDTPDGIQGVSLWKQLSGHPKSHVYSASQIHGGNLQYRSIRSDQYKLCTKQLVNLELSDISDLKTIQSIIGYVFGHSEILLELPNEHPIDDKAKQEELMNELHDHLSDCEIAATQTEKSQTQVDIDDETALHLKNLGYK